MVKKRWLPQLGLIGEQFDEGCFCLAGGEGQGDATDDGCGHCKGGRGDLAGHHGEDHPAVLELTL